ncbi:unnamed protein product [Thlaspi arvense]|uniref:Uncharacterized protein n=1 Tax=Thlaspi arvense TaxID=13288 RepID=A0AAU9RVK3_THLAR|nr:unnamed protein product [Thlaspi arvense]
MSGSGGFAVSRAHGGDRFYNPPALRRHRQFLQQQQHLKRQQRQQLQRPVKSEAAPLEAGSRADWDDLATTLSKHRSVCSSSSSPRPQTDLTNLDRLMESVSPSVRAQYLSEVMVRECRAQESDIHPYYCLEDLWESFRESSAYGVGVPLVLNGKDSIVQYYVPFLSGIQLYVESLKSPSRLR